MSKLEYNVGETVETESGNLAYLQHKSKKTDGFGVTFSRNETPLNLIGWINPYCLGDGFIKTENISNKLDERAHVEKYGLSYFHKKRHNKK
jgi:hypothetical protein